MQNPLGTMKKYEIALGWVYFPMFLLGTQFLIAVVLAIMGNDLQSMDTLLTLNVWNSVINFVVIIAIFHRFLFAQLRPIKGKVGRLIGTVAIGFAIYYGGTLLVNLLKNSVSILTGTEFTNQNQEAFEDLLQTDALRSSLIALLCAPFVEECLMRGLIFRPLYPHSRVFAYALSMLVFSFLHVFGSLLNGGVSLSEVLWNIATYLPAGFALAWAYARTRTIWGSIFLHLTVNAVSTVLLLLLQPLSEQLQGF